MRRRWIRNRPGRRENLIAAAAGVGAGAVLAGVVFWLGRLLLARDPVRPPGQVESPGEGAAATREEGRA